MPSRTDFVRNILLAVAAVAPDFSTRAKLMVVAHAGFESEWGHCTAYLMGHNLFNITRAASDPGPIVLGPDTEYDAQGKVTKIIQRFARYATFEEGIRHYLEFIGAPHYAPALDQLKEGDTEFIITLGRPPSGKPPYYTLPISEYVRRYETCLVSVMTEAGPLGLQFC